MYNAISIQSIINSFSRFIFIIVFCVLLNMGLNGALLSVNIGTIAGGVISYHFIKKIFLKVNKNDILIPKISPVLREVLPIGTTLILMSLILHLDLIIVPLYFKGKLAGKLSRILMTSRLAFFLPGLIYFIVCPEGAMLESIKNKKIFLIHPMLCFYITMLIVYYSILKILRIKPFVPIYGKIKKSQTIGNNKLK